MLESLTIETLVGGGLIGVSALVLTGGLLMMRKPQTARKTADIDAAVRDAPYHRLHNVLPASGE